MITAEDREIIFHTCEPSHIHKGEVWRKKGDTLFDVTTGSYSGAEECKLVNLLILFRLASLFREK